jgi:hypothetical protein
MSQDRAPYPPNPATLRHDQHRTHEELHMYGFEQVHQDNQSLTIVKPHIRYDTSLPRLGSF